MTILPPPHRVLVTDFFRGDQIPLLKAARPKIEFRAIAPQDLTPHDIAWAEAMIAFRPPKHLEVRGPKWIHGSGAGVDAWLFRREFPADVLLTSTGVPASSVRVYATVIVCRNEIELSTPSIGGVTSSI